MPLSEGATYTIGFEGREAAGDDPWVDYQRVTPGYFQAMGIPLLRGRLFTGDDREGAPGVVVVNDFAARRFWPGEDPIGRRVFLGSREPLSVIGIVGDVRQHSLASELRPQMYRSWLQEPDALTYVVRTHDRRLLRTLSAPDATIGTETLVEVRSLDEYDSRAEGPYASSGDPGHGRVAARDRWGCWTHGSCRLATCRLFQSMLFGVPARDPFTFVASTVVLMTVAIVAAWLPARRAALLDPAITLRQD